MESNQEKKLGKIQSVSFGLGGYQEAMLGLSVTLHSEKDHWGVADFKGTWDYNIIEVIYYIPEDTISNIKFFIDKILDASKR